MSVLEEFKYARDKVAFLLERYPQLRDNDKELYLSYLFKFHNLKKVLNSSKDPYKTFCKLFLHDKTISFNTIRRVRAKFQQDGLFPASEKVKLSRSVAAEDMTSYYSDKKE